MSGHSSWAPAAAGSMRPAWKPGSSWLSGQSWRRPLGLCSQGAVVVQPPRGSHRRSDERRPSLHPGRGRWGPRGRGTSEQPLPASLGWPAPAGNAGQSHLSPAAPVPRALGPSTMVPSPEDPGPDLECRRPFLRTNILLWLPAASLQVARMNEAPRGTEVC
nr:uncharacterized protein LOC115865839 isoform X2 [Globicephala melas]